MLEPHWRSQVVFLSAFQAYTHHPWREHVCRLFRAWLKKAHEIRRDYTMRGRTWYTCSQAEDADITKELSEEILEG